MKKLILIFLLFITSCYQADDHYLREEAAEIVQEDLKRGEYKPRVAKYLIIHCIATDPAYPWSAERLKSFFKQELKWNRYGYNYYILQDGTIGPITPINGDNLVDFDELTYNVSGYNSVSFAISLEGGVRRVGRKLVIEDNFTDAQIASLIYLTEKIKSFNPGIKVLGHNDLNKSKACPVLDISFLKT